MNHTHDRRRIDGDDHLVGVGETAIVRHRESDGMLTDAKTNLRATPRGDFDVIFAPRIADDCPVRVAAGRAIQSDQLGAVAVSIYDGLIQARASSRRLVVNKDRLPIEILELSRCITRGYDR